MEQYLGTGLKEMVFVACITTLIHVLENSFNMDC